MGLKAGDTLGPYEILGELGHGGMGSVYRARDPRLARDVAIKVSEARFSERFEREARAIAALNHPNICTLYDVGPNYLVMEHVEGSAPKGPLPLEEVLRITAQIAAALEAAHEKNITHRDLKPGNIIVRSDGTVKVLDFGLAKIQQAEGGSPEDATVTMGATLAGQIMGTPAYMSPEQARGQVVDKRADIWALGVIVHELVTGERLFEGATVTDVLAAVVRSDIDLSKMPAELRKLVARCLERDPKKRLRDAGDAMALVEETPRAAAVAPSGRSWLAMAGWAAAAVALGAAGFLYVRQPVRVAREVTRLEITVPEGLDTSGRSFTLSPDGRKLAVGGVAADGMVRILVREMDSLEMRALPGTETQRNSPPVFWSPDSRYIAYTGVGGQLMKVDLLGSPPQPICNVSSSTAVSGSWNSQGVILFGSVNGPIYRVSASGGTPEPLTVVDNTRKETRHAFPTFLPDGRHFLYLRSSSAVENTGVFVGSIDVQPGEQSKQMVAATPFGPGFTTAPSGQSYMLLLRDGVLLAQPVDSEGTPRGEMRPLQRGIGSNIAAGFFTASADGKLVIRSKGSAFASRFQWFFRDGSPEPGATVASGLGSASIAPDGGRVVVADSQNNRLTMDLWLLDSARGTRTRLTQETRFQVASPVWFPDGQQVAFASIRDGSWNLYKMRSDGSGQEQLLLRNQGGDPQLTGISGDGALLLFQRTDSKTRGDIWMLELGPGNHQPQPLLNSESNESQARFVPGSSPRYFAYTSDESGTAQVYVRSLAAGGARLQVSQNGGSNPRWRGDGKELYFAAPDGTVMAVDVTDAFKPRAPQAIFKVPSAVLPLWDVSPDGQKFLMTLAVEQGGRTPFTVLLDWEALLKQ